MPKKEDSKELQDLKREHEANEISDREYEERKAEVEKKNKPAIEQSAKSKIEKPETAAASAQRAAYEKSKVKIDPVHKTLKTIRNLLIALIAVMVLGLGFVVGYIIYTEASYSDDLYYDDSLYEDYIEEGGEELSEDGEVAY